MDAYERDVRRTGLRVGALRRLPVWAPLLAYGALYMSWMILRWGPSSDRRVIGDLFQTLLNLPMIVLCWKAARRCGGVAALHSAWRLITASAILALSTNLAQLYYEGTRGTLPHPSLYDVFMLCAYVPVIAALVRFPTARASGVQRLQLTLDAAVLAIGGAVVMWYLYLGPAVIHPIRQPLAVGLVSVVSTVGDLIALAATAGLLIRGTMPSSARAMRLFAAGCLAYVTADVLGGYVTVRLHQTYSGGDWLDPVWFLGMVLWALGASAQRQPEPGELAQLRTTLPTRRRPSWMPYVAVGVGLALTAYTERHSAFFPSLSLLLASALLVALVCARQLAAQSELLDVQRELQCARDELAALATTDALTGLPNHRALVTAIDHELERSARSEQRFALAFLDLDHFKALNDTLGHAAGDSALHETAQLIKSTSRGVDAVGRWGGEEFVVLLPDADTAEALQAAERIRAAIARHQFNLGQGAHLTCSIGVAAWPTDGVDRDTLVRGADRAMYAAKQLGRNQVIAASDHTAAVLAADAAISGREEQALLGAVEALAAVVDARDSYVGAHSADVAVLSQRLALTLGCDANQTHLVGLAARLHDVGKVGVPDVILNKPGRLTDDEWQLIQQHPAVGADIAGRIPRLRSITPLIKGHHERYDGTGYPDRLAREAIPLGARIICAADAYSAMITDRPYRSGRGSAEALKELRRCAGTQFDPRIVEALAQIVADDEAEAKAA